MVHKPQSNLVDGHLKGAMTIMNSFPAATDPTGMFLERVRLSLPTSTTSLATSLTPTQAFRFYDVIAALSFGTAPLSQAPGRSCVQPLPPTGAPIPCRLSSVDTLLGMSTTLWPIIHRLSKLSSDKSDLETANRSTHASSSKKAVFKTEFETNARAIERELTAWQPTLPADFDPAAPVRHARLHSIFNNAMAYRHSCLVHLYHTIHGLPRAHARMQHHAHLALWHCRRTCAHAGPICALLWPLFVAACEAVTDEDRVLAADAFAEVERRQGMLNIKWAWDIVQEVWRQADLMEDGGGEGEGMEEGTVVRMAAAAARGGDFLEMDVSTPHLWRRVSEQMGISIVFG